MGNHKRTPVYILTIHWKKKRKPLNYAMGPNQKTLYDIGDKDFGSDARVEKIEVRPATGWR